MSGDCCDFHHVERTQLKKPTCRLVAQVVEVQVFDSKAFDH